MTPQQQAAYDKIRNRCDLFGRYKINYKNNETNETETRTNFIDPFFEALGWDMHNWKGLSPNREEVRREQTVFNEETLTDKRPDYSFRNEKGKDLFYVEAKKPNVEIYKEKDPALQIREYGWNSRMNVGIITDFEEFAVYDCRVPLDRIEDNALTARTDYFQYFQYTETSTFNYLWEYFSRDNVIKGSLANYVRDAKRNFSAKALPVDEAFLLSLEKWRSEIAIAIIENNPHLSLIELNYIVQATLNRVIFLRNCEDRHIEPRESLKGCLQPDKKANDGEYYRRLLKLFEKADRHYNAGLFRMDMLDNLAYRISVDNAKMKAFIEGLYFPKSPYRYDLISVDILGTAYERFLGNVISIREKKNAKGQILVDTDSGISKKEAITEPKPEVRKAGGVFYTPQYIVEYIVENTVGKLIAGKTPDQIAALRFCDPACGSGSFLLGVYQYLLEYHLEYYNRQALQQTNDNNLSVTTHTPLNENGGLSIAEKKRILTNNIFGVDIDAQAIEVTKLSLLLECMANPDPEEAKGTHLLPNIDANIQCGNSLIDTEFNWHTAFPQVFEQGGFDAIVGNPPYVKERGSKEIFEPILHSRIGKLYHQGKMDLWYYFVHRAIDILRPNGFLGFITNSYWMKGDGASKLIDRIQLELTIDIIVDFNDYKVFPEVSGKHNIAIYFKGAIPTHKCRIFTINKETPNNIIANYRQLVIENTKLFSNSKINIGHSEDLFSGCYILEEHFEVSQGVVEATDKITKSQMERTNNTNHSIGDGVFVLSKKEVEQLNLTKIEKKVLKPYVNTLHIKRWQINFQEQYLLYLGKEERKEIFDGNFPNIKKHLDRVQEFITSSNAPYGIHRTRDARFFEEPKLICKGMFATPEFTYDDQKFYCGFSFSVIIQKTGEHDLKFLLACMNSNIGKYWFKINGKNRGIGVDIGVKVFRLFPLPIVKEKAQHDRIVTLVEQILKDKADSKDTTALEAEIDTIVYQLYGLTEEEIKMVEG